MLTSQITNERMMEIVRNRRYLRIEVRPGCSYRPISGISGIYERKVPEKGEKEAYEVIVYLIEQTPHDVFECIETSLSNEKGLSVITIPKGKYTDGYFTIFTHSETDFYQVLRRYSLI